MVIEKPRFYIRLILKFLLIVTGSMPVPIKYKKLQNIVVIFGFLSYIILFHSMIWSVVNSPSFALISESLAIFLILISSFAMVFLTILRRRIFILIIDCIDKEPENSIKVINANFMNILKKVFGFISFCEILYLISGVTTSSTNDIEFGKPESLYIPGYIPWRYDTPIRYTFSVLYQLLLLFYPFTINYVTIATLVGFYTYIDFKFEQLLTLLDDLQYHQMIIPVGQWNKHSDDLIQIIRSYQHWKRLSKNLATYVSDYSSTIIFCAVLCSAWSITILASTEITISVKVKNSCLLFYTTSQLITICILGEYFLQTDDGIRKSIYNTLWYTSNSNKSRISIIVFMLLTQKPMQVKAYGMIPVDANLSLRMLKIIYSVFNLYRNSYATKSTNN